MKFSVLVSVYSKEDPSRFSQALESILNQTLMPDEITIVEDGPLTNDLYSVIDRYKDEYLELFTIIKLEKNSGLGIALNNGLLACRHEYVARMDSDDIAEPDRFMKQIAYLKDHPSVDLVGAYITEFDESMKKKTDMRIVPIEHLDIISQLRERNPINHVTVIYKKSTVINCGSYEDFPYFEDYYLWCKLAVNESVFHNIPESLVNVRGGLSMIQRRGGMLYVKKMFKFQLAMRSLGLITRWQLLKNVFVRGVVALAPSFLRKIFYAKAVRTKV